VRHHHCVDTAKFGQPEITLGVIPGMGGTQRLTRAVGKAKAMDLCLTGRIMEAEEAERSGLVARVVAADELMATAIKAAEKIAGFSLPVAMMVKESVNRADEMTLAEGLRFERRLFHSLFATEDQKEGMGRLCREAQGAVQASLRQQAVPCLDATAAGCEVFRVDARREIRAIRPPSNGSFRARRGFSAFRM
jgi:enoyl-CoA hydratase/carnithine racemase